MSRPASRLLHVVATGFVMLTHQPCEARDDWQLWMEQKWSVGLTKDVKLIGKTEERYRNKSKLSLEIGKDWYSAAPYVANEVFYGARAGEWTRNRVSLGIEKPLTKQLGAEVYCAVDSTKQGSDWNEFHILGLSLSGKF